MAKKLFLNRILSIVISFTQLKLIFCVSILICINYIHSTYFQCSTILDQLSLSYYQTNNDNFNNLFNIWIDLMLVCVLIVIYDIFCKILFKLEVEQKDTSSSKILVGNVQSSDTQIYTDYTRQQKICNAFLFGLYLTLFMIGTLVVILSIIVDYLPSDNVFEFDQTQTRLVDSLLPVVLTINSSMIIPRLIDKMHLCYKLCFMSNQYNESLFATNVNYSAKYRSFYILFLRTLSLLAVPLIASLIIIPNCGNNWFYFWNKCNDKEKRDNFDIYYDYAKNVQLFSWQDICKSKGFNDINWNKCIRTFSSRWSLVVTKKLCIMIVSPIIIVFWKYFKNYAINKCKSFYGEIKHKDENMLHDYRKNDDEDDHDDNGDNNNNDDNNKNDRMKIKGDLEYAMFATKCQSLIIWFPISPIVIPLTGLAFYTNYYIYNLMIEKYNWQLIPFDVHIKFPVHFIGFSTLISQFYLCIFVFVCIGNQFVASILMTSLIILDIVYFAKYYYLHKYGKQYKWNCNLCKSRDNGKKEKLLSNQYQQF